MPVQSPRMPSAARLTDQLSAQLKAELSLDEPFIVEQRTAQTQSRHVLVIWDAWQNLPRDTRAAIIMNAYRAANLLKGDTIRVALGLTQEEALDLGYLPFQITTTVRNTDPVDFKDIRKALEGVGGIQVKVGSSLQVRFPSQEY